MSLLILITSYGVKYLNDNNSVNKNLTENNNNNDMK